MVSTNRWTPMQSSSRRRVHSAELKAQVIETCRQPGASVAAVALSHGLNANLVRKWLVGRGLKRTGLGAPQSVSVPRSEPSTSSAGASGALQFMPIDLARKAEAAGKTVAAVPTTPTSVDASIHIEVSRGELGVKLRWPASQADACATLLRELLAPPR